MSECDQDHCITCGDEARGMTVEGLDVARSLASCADQQGRRWIVDITLVEPVNVGDRLLVHAGVALVTG